MKKLTVLLLALSMLMGFAAQAETDVETEVFAPVPARVRLSLAGNPTTGYEWACSLKNFGVVELIEEGYAEDAHEDGMTGVGGAYHFVFSAVAPGQAVVELRYGRAWEDEPLESKVRLITVLEDGAIAVSSLDGIAPLSGTVTGLEDGAALVNTQTNGDVLCRFPQDMDLPVMDEQITVWFSGAMTASLPGQINVLAWETVPAEKAR